MSEDYSEKKSHSDEIDVKELLERGAAGVGKMLAYCGKVLGNVSLFLVRKSPWLIAAMLIGGIVAFVWYKADRRYYSSLLMLKANVLDNTFYVNAITPMQGLKPEVLARSLDIPDSVAKQVHSIKAFYGVDRNGDGIADDILDYKRYMRNVKDSTYRIAPGVFYVEANVYNESHYELLGNALLGFINANPYVVEHEKFHRYRIDQELAGVDVQIFRLDSLQRSEYQKNVKDNSLKLGGSQLLMFNEQDRQLFHDYMFGLYSRRLNLEAEKALYSDAVIVLKQFVPLEKPVNTILFYAKRIIPLFLLIGILSVVLLHYRREVWDLVVNKHH